MLIGFDIGGTKCAVSLGEARDGGFAVADKIRLPTAGAPLAMLDALTEAARAMLARRGASLGEAEAIGVSCGGPLSAARGVVLSPPNLPGWDAVPVVEYLTARTGLPAALENDANACAVAEWRWGAGRGTRNMIFLTFGTGLGAGLIVDGRLYRGATENAGEIGHVRLTPDGPVGYGKAGSCEGWCSGGGIARLARRMAEEDARGAAPLLASLGGDPERITAAAVARLAEAAPGDPFCRAVYERSGAMLGRTLAILADVLDPERIVIGSIFARSEALLRAAMEETLRAEALTAPQIVPAALGEAIGDYAALAVAAGAAEMKRENGGKRS